VQIDRQTFASDSLSIVVCTRFDCSERSGKTCPGIRSPTSPRAKFEIIENRAGVGGPEDLTSPSYITERMKRLGRTSKPIRIDWNKGEFARSLDDFDRQTVLSGADVQILDFVCEIARYMFAAGLSGQTLARDRSGYI
jgi:hypothetical protein